METIIGSLEKIETLKAKNGKDYFMIHVSGKKYSIFDKSFTDGLVIGQDVQITGEKNEKGYFQLKSIKSLDSGGDRSLFQTPNKNISPSPPAFHLTREECRARSMEIAVELVKNKLTTTPVFEVAEEIFKYINS